jgi:hypothetical protein
VDQLREQMQNAKRFDALTSQLAALATEEGAAQRAALALTAVNRPTADAKKNSMKNACKKDTRRAKPVSPRSRAVADSDGRAGNRSLNRDSPHWRA